MNGFLLKNLLYLKLQIELKAWDESQHPREPAGSDKGGEFTKKDYTDQQKKDADELEKKALESADELDNIAKKYASEFDANVTKINIKTKESILRKAVNEYEGDVTLIKDSVRNTIIAPQDKIDKLLSRFEADKNILRIKKQLADKDPLGYSGYIVNYKLKNGTIGEIQINTAKMIYAKEKEAYARSILGPVLYYKVKREIKTPGGLGHTFYEEWRMYKRETKRKLQIAKQSKAYYALFR